MKLLRRGASSRRKTADVGPVGVSVGVGVGGPRRWRPTGATSSPPKVVNGPPGVTWSLILDYLRSRTSYKVTLLVVAGNLIVCVVLAVTLNASTSTPEQSSNPPAFTELLIETPPPEKEDPNNTLPGGNRIITKQQWGGRPAGRHFMDTLAHPTPYVIVSHTATAPCFDFAECSMICRDIQEEHMGGELSFPDIGPNFLVGGDGNVYVGRGWDVPNSRAGLGGLVRRKNIEISFIGNFVYDEPTKGQLRVALELLDIGVYLGKLTLDYKLYSHNDTDASLSPGINLFINIKEWPHFTHPGGDV